MIATKAGKEVLWIFRCQFRLAKKFHALTNMIHNETTWNKPPVSSGNKGGQMIVEESFGNFFNVYVDG